jgi:hypothetical protein
MRRRGLGDVNLLAGNEGEVLPIVAIGVNKIVLIRYENTIHRSTPDVLRKN